MHVAECASCGGRFSAKRQTAKWCSERCRKRAQRTPVIEMPPTQRSGPPVVALPKREPDENGLLATTRRELEAADRLNTSKGQAALLVATILDSGIQDTGSSIAALIREHRAAMTAALDGVRQTQTPIERIRGQRERKAG